MDIIFALNVYQEEFMLPECLDSIRRFHPEARIIAVDGAYKSFIQENKKQIALCIEKNQHAVADQLMRFTVTKSPDRTVEILKSYGAEVIEPTAFDESIGDFVPWEHEYEKRSRYLIGNEGDYYFVLDADERIEGRVNPDELKNDAYNIILARDDNTVPYPVLRLFRHYPGIQYKGAHHAIWIKGVLHKHEHCKNYPGVRIIHRHQYRQRHDPMRLLAKGAYYRYLTNTEEAAFRMQYKL